MNKKEFLDLQLKEQIKFLNQELQQKSIREITKNIGIARTTLRDTLARQGYFYSKKDNKYIIKNNQKEDMELIAPKGENTSIKSNFIAKPTKESKIKKEIKSTPNTITTKELNKKDNKYTMFSSKEIEELRELLQHDVLKEFNNFCKKNSHIKQQNIITFILQNFLENK